MKRKKKRRREEENGGENQSEASFQLLFCLFVFTFILLNADWSVKLNKKYPIKKTGFT